MQPWKHEPYVAFDTETTGFGSEARILSIAAILFREGDWEASFVEKICPRGVDWEDEKVQHALEKNGIKREELDGCPRIDEVLDGFITFCKRGQILVAHNAEFDRRMIRQERERVKASTGQVFDVKVPLFVADTMHADLLLNPGDSFRRNLAEVSGRWGVEPFNAHNANADAMACGRVFSSMMVKLPSDLTDMRAFVIRGRSAWAARGHR